MLILSRARKLYREQHAQLKRRPETPATVRREFSLRTNNVSETCDYDLPDEYRGTFQRRVGEPRQSINVYGKR